MRKANAAIPILGLGLVLLLAWAPVAGADTYTYTYNAADQLASVQGPPSSWGESITGGTPGSTEGCPSWRRLGMQHFAVAVS